MYLHKTKNEDYTPPCCYFSGELEVVEGIRNNGRFEEDYFEALKDLGNRAAVSSANLVLMGIEPTYPSEKYGYIIPEGKENVSKVLMFKEKPTQRAFLLHRKLRPMQ